MRRLEVPARVRPVAQWLRHYAGRLGEVGRRKSVPLEGWPPAGPIKVVDGLSAADLQRLNELLPWSCFTVDALGRRFGSPAWGGKRDQPQPVPDRRLALMDERFGLAGTAVLEVGCFEGVHTIGLCERAARVLALDSRIENVVKTVVRTAMYGHHPEVAVVDLDAAGCLSGMTADLVHHVGVLYHLRRPVEHLHELAKVVARGVMLDTHVASPTSSLREDSADGFSYRYQRYEEHGRSEVFSGMGDHARWLPLDELERVLVHAGFDDVSVFEQRAERNGPRVLLFAERSQAPVSEPSDAALLGSSQ